MNQQEENNIIILRYIKGELNDEELRTFEQRMANDPAFAEEVEFAKQYHAFQERKEFEAALKTFNRKKEEEGFFEEVEQQVVKENDIKTSPKAQKSITKWLYPLVAAAILIGLLLAWLLPLSADLNTSEEIIAEVVEIPTNFTNTYVGRAYNTGDTTPVEILEVAVEAYRNEQYKAAATGFETFLESAKKDEAVEFYLAKCYLVMQPPQTDKAISILENISERGLYENQIILHLGAAYIRRGEYDTAIQFLQKEQANLTDYLEKFSNLIKEAKQKKRQ